MDRIEVKFQSDNFDEQVGSFKGYAAVFGNIDLGGDVIVKGAFRDSLRDWKKKKKLPKMMLDHGWRFGGGAASLPVGKFDAMEEDDTGLYVEGRLFNADTDLSKHIYVAMKEGEVDSMSIGYKAVDFAYGTKPNQAYRTLKKVDLFEVSLVTFPMNDLAVIDSVKAADLTERELERRLTRDAGLSRSVTRSLMAGGFDAIKAMQDAGDDDGLSELAQFMRSTQGH